MDDMNAFERQLARDAVRDVGPIRPVDDLAIFNTIAATQSPKWRFQSMFSATKFVVAGAIVALFGGFLLAGVLTQPSDEQMPAAGASATAQAELTAEPAEAVEVEQVADTSVRSDILPGVELEVEGVSPGVLKILADGAAHAFTGPSAGGFTRLAFPPGDALLVCCTADEKVVALGEPGSRPYTEPPFGSAHAPDGSSYGTRGGGNGPVRFTRTVDGEWEDLSWPSDAPRGFTVQGDGTPWVLASTALGRFDGDDWTLFPFAEELERLGLQGASAAGSMSAPASLVSAPDGSLWFGVRLEDGPSGALVRFDGSTWEVMRPLGEDYEFLPGAMATGGGGDLWAALTACRGEGCLEDEEQHRSFLGHYHDGAWTVLDEGDGVRDISSGDAEMAVSPDGLLLTTFARGGGGDGHAGLAVFDRQGEHVQVPADLFDVAVGVAGAVASPDGSFWFITYGQASEGDAIYVITPEARAQDDAVTTEPLPSEDDADDTGTTPDLLPGVDLVTEEVEPRVYRVLSDGIRDLARSGEARDGAIVAGLDGSVWQFRPEGFYRLGEESTHGWGDQRRVFAEDDMDVDPDGTIWRVPDPRGADEERSVARGDARLLSFDGEDWTVRLEKPSKGGRGAVLEVEVLPDGEVWAAWVTGLGTVRVGRLVGGDWVALPGTSHSMRPFGIRAAVNNDETLALTDAGEVWFRGRSDQSVFQHDGSAWREPLLGDLLPVVADAGGASGEAGGVRPLLNMDVGPGGTGWLNLGREGVDGDWSREDVPHLARFDGDSVVDYFERTDLPTIDEAGGHHPRGAFYEVAPDGSLWYGSRHPQVECFGLVNFDGEDIERFLEDLCVHQADIAPDGSVWAQAGPDDSVSDTYVITPEAVATTE